METIKISATQEPSLVQVVVSVVTKCGQYLDKSQARFLVGRGDVYVNGLRIKDITLQLDPGLYTMRIRGNSYNVQVAAVDKE